MDSNSKYVDIAAIVQIIGCVFNQPSLLDNEKYIITEKDFCKDFHRILFGSIYKLYNSGAKTISIGDIENFLSAREKDFGTYKANKGQEYLLKLSSIAEVDNFDIYYNRLKKMSILRAYDDAGVDVRFLYDPGNIFDIKKKQLQEDYLLNASLQEIVDKIDRKIDSIKETFSDNIFNESAQAGDGIEDLISRLQQTPDVGVPLFGDMVNTVTRGARLKKFYLRSGPTGTGKSRTMIADACNIACNSLYDEQFGWIKNGTAEPTLYISTELEIDEIQTMMLAFISNVEEEHIINGDYKDGELERVQTAAQILKESQLYIEVIPDFTLRDIENLIKRNIREHEIKYVFYDYIHSSLGILGEITKATGGVKLREDNILFMLSIRLKDLCNQYGVFILSSTQVNSDYQTSEHPDQNLLRGAKAIADKIDAGWHILPVTKEDLESLDSIMKTNIFATPNVKLAFYKNRRSRYKNVILWCSANLGTCRVKPMFATDYNYNLITMENLKILVEEKEN